MDPTGGSDSIERFFAGEDGSTSSSSTFAEYSSPSASPSDRVAALYSLPVVRAIFAAPRRRAFHKSGDEAKRFRELGNKAIRAACSETKYDYFGPLFTY